MEQTKREVVVFGGTRGVGFAIACNLYNKGYAVTILGSTEEQMEKALIRATKKNIQFQSYIVDATNEQSVETFFDIFKRERKLFASINCVGKNLSQRLISVDKQGEIRKHSLDDWERTININLKSAFLCCREAAALMVQQQTGGVIVNIATSLWRGAYAQSAYTAAKAGVVSLTKSMAYELSKYQIRCMAVAPGVIDGDALEKACRSSDGHKKYMMALREQTPIKRFVYEAEVAEAIAFVLNVESLTGKVIEVDGGGMPPKAFLG